MFDEVFLVVFQLVPVFEVRAKVDLIDGPEASHLIFVHLPDVVVLDRQQHKAVRVLFKERFRESFFVSLGLTGESRLRLGAFLGLRGKLRVDSAVALVVLFEELGPEAVLGVGFVL